MDWARVKGGGGGAFGFLVKWEVERDGFDFHGKEREREREREWVSEWVRGIVRTYSFVSGFKLHWNSISLTLSFTFKKIKLQRTWYYECQVQLYIELHIHNIEFHDFFIEQSHITTCHCGKKMHETQYLKYRVLCGTRFS